MSPRTFSGEPILARKRDTAATTPTSGKGSAPGSFSAVTQGDKIQPTLSESVIMTQDLVQSTQTSPAVAGLDVVTPLSSRALFWRPRFLADSASLHHLPFLFWLADTLRPKSFVSIGGGDGVAYFALCQAAEKLDLDARGYGFGPWAGTEGETPVPADLLRYNRETYPDVGRLSASDPGRGAARFPPGSVDLLSVMPGQGGTDQEARLRAWLDSDWPHRMSARGVLLIHGANALLEQGGADGVLARLLAAHPAFHLELGEGVLLVLYGSQPEERLLRLCRMGVGEPGYAAVLQVFGRLGGAIRSEKDAQTQRQTAETLKQRLSRAERDLAQSRQAEDEARAALEKLNTAYDARNRQLAETQARLLDLQMAQSEAGAAQTLRNEELNAALAEAEARAAALQAEVAEKDAALAELGPLRATLEAAQNKENWLRKSLQAANEGAKSQAEALRARVQALETELATARQQSEATTRALREDLEEAQAEAARTLREMQAERDLQAAETEARIAELISEAEAEAEKIATLTLSLEQATEHQQRLQAEWDAQRGDLQRQLRALAAERDALDADLAQQRAEGSAIATRLAATEAAMAETQTAMAQEVAALQAAAVTARQEWQGREETLQTEVRALQAQVLELTGALRQSEAREAASLATLTEGFESRQIAAEAQREALLRELRQQQEAEAALRQDLDSLRDSQARQERTFAQTRTMLEDDVENLQALLREQLATVDRLRTECDAARAQAKALDNTIAEVLGSTSWKLTAPMRKLLESVRNR